MKKALKLATTTLSLLAMVGCGQGFDPASDPGIASPHGGGDVFDSNTDDTNYRTASYEVLRYTMTNALGLGNSVAPNAAGLCGTTAVASCPRANPVSYLDQNRASLGTPVYNQNDPLSTQTPGPMTSGGFKVWTLAASSACGRMMNEQPTPALFPNGIEDYNHMYNVLLGRMPTQAEVEVLDSLKANYTAVTQKQAGTTLEQVQGAAVCSAVLGSLEFLTVN